MKILFISAAILVTDQVSKFYIKGFSIPWLNIYSEGITPGAQHNILNDKLIFTLIENPGFAFGINPGIEFKFYLTFITFLITAGLFLYLYLFSRDNKQKRIAAAILLGGAAGNLIDRIFYGVIYDYASIFHGNVVDFISLRINDILPLSFSGNYVFNIADLAVAAGLILFLVKFNTSEITSINSLAAENQE